MKRAMKKELNPMNGTMVQNFTEMKENGKIMESMDTNKELKEKGKQPDPKQDTEPK
ncbi:hypothetical protein ACTHO0_24280 [Cytobacillus praedii]|uniref:hypothetical protein n=1 Tax=Cytobacillus praedii TaxID=1742358 RepID=UPI000ABAB7FA|nr:hypothetical protein [Cytobacillus praedii]MED3550661.1 hypothetical protein [Cytobacillus praedii]MED3572605.1 hypothetical protein [Cytobacillus praedii]